MTPFHHPIRVLKICYFCHFVYLGTVVAFMPVYLAYLGLNKSQIGTLFSGMAVSRIISALFMSFIADKFQNRKRVLIVAIAGTFFGLTGLLATRTYPQLLANLFVIGLFIGPVIPMLDATTIDQLGDKYHKFGRIRLYGTLSFGLATLGLGYLIKAFTPGVIVIVLILSYGCMLIMTPSLPDSQLKGNIQFSYRELKGNLFRRRILIFLLTGFIFNLAFTAYNIFFSLHLKQIGYSSATIGFAWLLSTLAEAGYFFAAPAVSRRFRSESLIFLAYALTGLRWLMMSWSSSLTAILFLQLLHAISFGGFYAALVNFVRENFSPGLRTMAQSLMLMVNYGLAIIMGASLSGWIFEQFGGFALFNLAGWLTLVAAALFGGDVVMKGRKKT
ncbi:MAG: MFS transporter [candidate division KSB1 bacterium]|nr:MFS transporter [candidate division KSB1 bacterium]